MMYNDYGVAGSAGKNVRDTMAVLRVTCRNPYRKLYWRLMNPLKQHYKVHIEVDGREYVLNSKDRSLEIPVAPGQHYYYVGNVSSKKRNRTAAVGSAAKAFGSIVGDSDIAITGRAMEYAGVDSGEYRVVNVNEGEVYEIHVRQDWLERIVEET